MDRNKDLSIVLLSDPCQVRSVQVQTIILKESTICSFKTRVIKKIKDVSKEQREDTQSLKKYSKPTGHPLSFGELDCWKHRHRFVKLEKKLIQAYGVRSLDEDIV